MEKCQWCTHWWKKRVTVYDCDGNEISYPINTEDQFGPSRDDENEQTTKSANADEVLMLICWCYKNWYPAERERNQRDLLIELPPLCNNSDLQKDAAFVDDFEKFIKTHDTSSKVLPNLTATKKKYLIARRQVKNHIFGNTVVNVNICKKKTFYSALSVFKIFKFVLLN